MHVCCQIIKCYYKNNCIFIIAWVLIKDDQKDGENGQIK